jgi:hypothetical protein
MSKLLGEEVRQPRLGRTLVATRRSAVDAWQYTSLLVYFYIFFPDMAIRPSALPLSRVDQRLVVDCPAGCVHWRLREGGTLAIADLGGLAGWDMLASSMESGFQCAACGEWNTTSVDESAGRRQSYVEDCQVCCKPNVLRVEYDTSSQEFFITAELE